MQRAPFPLLLLPLLLVLWAAPGCGETTLAADTRAGVRALALEYSRNLVSSPPHRWKEPWSAALALGRETTRPLILAVRENPGAAGCQAAVHLLGELGDPAARPFLEETLGLADPGPLATEAALALGRLGKAEAEGEAVAGSVRLLEGVVLDPGTDIATRCAAACALLDLGQPEKSLPMLQAILLAATPYARELARELRIPDKSRWAHERYMVISAIGRYAEGRTFGLDEDASWPRLEQGVKDFLAYAQARTKEK